MGKSNKANRTKGNTRPSSSDHSAQLLSGRALTGFIGFEALEKETASYVPVTGQQVSDCTDHSVDSDFRMVMRKMLKRDAITRLKAIQEFGDYCVEKDKEIVKNVLRFWPRLFNRLSLDTDRRIREATHAAHGKLLTKVKRDIAPYLKNVMGVWLLGQCDLYAPAASSAQTAFAKTFQPPKQSEVLMFCKSEIFCYFKDNLFIQTAKSMSKPDPTTPEDMENTYILVISATLQALKLFLNSVLPKEHDEIQEEFHSIVTDNKFWKFAKNKEAQIRGSWFALISSICNVKPSYFNQMEQKLATTVFSCLSESNPMVAPSVWESALSIVVNFENCWEGIDIHKVALPHLWSLLMKGGKGNAHVLFPCLLPFLSKLPKQVGESEEFLLEFFSSFKGSLMLDTVAASSIECDAILKAFFECLQFICCTRLGSTSLGPVLLQNVLVKEILPLVDSSLYDPKCSHLATSELYTLLSSLIRKIEHLQLTLCEKMSKYFSDTLVTFWEAMLPVMCKYFTVNETEKEVSLAYISYLLSCLLQPFNLTKSKKKRKVRFVEEDTSDNPSPPQEILPSVSGISLSDKKTQSFYVIGKFCVLLCEKISQDSKLEYLTLLEEILSSASNGDFIAELVKAFSNDHGYEPHSSFGFFQNVMLKWVKESYNDGVYLDCFFRSLFIICSQVPDEEVWKILNCCCMTNVILLEQVLQKGLLSYKNQPFFQRWLATSHWSSELLRGLEELVGGKKFFCDSSAKLPICMYNRILTLCLSDINSKPLLDDASFETIICLVHNLCEQMIGLEMDYNIELALDFIHNVSIAVLQNPQICWKFRATDNLVYCIFQINLKEILHFEDTDKVSIKLYQILNSFMDSYIGYKDEIMKDDSLIYKIAKELRSSIQSLQTPKQASHIFHQCSFIMSSLQKAVAKHKPELNSTLFVSYKLMDEMLPTYLYLDSLKEGLKMNTLHWFLKKSVFYPMLTRDEFTYSDEQILKYSLVSDVISNILCSVISDSASEGEEYAKFCVHYIAKHLLHLLWFMTFCKGNGISESSVGSLSAKLEENCLKMLSFLPDFEINELKNKIFNMSHSDLSWSLCLQFLIEIFPSSNVQKSLEELFDITSKLEVEEMLPTCVVRQVLIPHLPSEKKILYLQELLQEIYKLEEINNEKFLGKMGELCCYLKSIEVQPSTEMLALLKEIWVNIINYDFENQDHNGINMHYMQMISVLSSLVDFRVDFLCPKVWPFFQKLLLSLTKEAKLKSFNTPRELLSLNQTAILFLSLSQLRCLIEKDECVSTFGCIPLLLSQKEIYENMIFLFQHVSGIFNKSKTVSEVCEDVLRNLLEAVNYIPGEHLVNILVAQNADSEDKAQEGKECSVLHSLISTLTSSVRPLQFASHTMLMKFMPFLPNLVAEEDCSQSEDDTEEQIRTPASLTPLIELLCFLNEIVDTMLLDIKIGDLCTVLPYTDSYVYAMAYLFAWMELFEFFSASPAQVRLGYALHLEEKLKLLSSLFSNLLRLMPENPILCLKKGLKVETPKKDDLKLLFIHPPVLKSDTPSSEEIQSVACYVYGLALRKLPAVIRTWFNNLDRKSSDIVNSFTSKYISGLLCMEEIQAVHKNEKLFDNLMVQARPGYRDVLATYSVDDCKIELCVQLPINYPLKPISSERRGKVVIGQREWRQWLMQLTTVLAYQNGTIIDGLHTWKKNLDKKFEGVEECMICYYILHSSTQKLPKLSCHVCRKKFHSACLYKWFRTSNNFTCPLCRNEFAM